MNNNKGITLITLVVTIIIIIIISTISLYEGNKLIGKSRLQTIETNMLTIQAKVKAYSEEIEAKIWTEKEESKNSARITKFMEKNIELTDDVSNEAISDSKNISQDILNGDETTYDTFLITGQALINMGLEELKDERYIALFDKNKCKLIDVIYPKGINYNRKDFYALSSIDEALKSE